MVWPLMVAGAAMQVYGAAKSSSAMKSAAKAQARAHLMTAEENIRRKGLQYAEMRKQTTAGIYASGVEMSGSSENYLRKMRTEMSRELAWQRMAAQAEAKAIKKGANIQANAGMISGIAGAMGSLGGAYYGSKGGYSPGVQGGGGGGGSSFGGFNTGYTPPAWKYKP
jgi:hypothetical protein